MHEVARGPLWGCDARDVESAICCVGELSARAALHAIGLGASATAPLGACMDSTSQWRRMWSAVRRIRGAKPLCERGGLDECTVQYRSLLSELSRSYCWITDRGAGAAGVHRLRESRRT